MAHIASHFILPALVVAVFYRKRWRLAALVLLGTMLVDLDHLLADPIYDPNRCSLDVHPLHATPVIAVYLLLAALPVLWGRGPLSPELPRYVLLLHLAGLGLVVHMGLDWTECLRQATRMLA